MLNRYGLGLAGIVVGALIVWGLFGFKNPFGNGTVPACSSLGLDQAQTDIAKAQGKCV